MEIGGDFEFLELWSFRLYLGVFDMYSVYFGFNVFLFIWVVYVRGRHYVFIFVSYFTCATLTIDLYYEVIHDICLLFSVL